MNYRPFLALASCAALAVTAACGQVTGQGTGQGTAMLPAAQQMNAAQMNTARASAPAPKTLLYAVTLNWNAGTGAVYAYDAYSNDSHAFKVVQFPQGFSEGLWTDVHGNVYVAVVNAGSTGLGYIAVYTPGLGKLLRTYTNGVSGPSGGIFDSAGNMYVSNICGPGATGCSVFARTRQPVNAQNGYVAVYPPGKTTPSKILQTGINIAVGLTRDKAGNIFVANNTGQIAWNVIEFPAGSTTGHVVAFKNIPSSRAVGAVTMDASGALLVSINSTIDFFPTERGQWSKQLTKGLIYADGLAYGPDGTLFAANYEFKQNEGNVIAFPPNSTSPARSYAVPYGNGVTGAAIGPSTPS